MAKNVKAKVSLRDVARAANVSVTAAGRALHNLPKVGEETRKRILTIADQLGYFPDPRLASRMVGIRQAATKDLLPIAWLNTHKNKNAWHEYKFLSPYLEGAQARCLESGYRLEEIWTMQPGLKMRRISQIIDTQGIEGVIISEPARHIRLNWSRLAAVAICGGLLAPALHRVTPDINFNLKLALKSAKRFGYRRIGVYMTEEMDRFSRHDARAIILYFNSTIPPANRVRPLFTPFIIMNANDVHTLFMSWLKREQPDVVVGASGYLVDLVKAAGYRVPEDMGVVHQAIEDDVIDWAGIYANKREVGRLAADMVISSIQNRQFGVPSVSSTRLIRGEWRAGRTLLIPKP